MRVLFLTHRLPYAANRGDRIRALHMIRQLAKHVEIDLFSLVHSEDEAAHASDLRDVASSVVVARVSRWHGYGRAVAGLATERAFTHSLLDSSDVVPALRQMVARRAPDVVLAYCSGMARFALEPPLEDFPMVLDMVDVDSEKWRSLGVTSTPPAKWIYTEEARRLGAFEARAAMRARSVLVVNEREREALLRLAPAADVRVVPNGIALQEFRPAGPPAGEPRVTFCGVMNYRPNEEAAVWFAQQVWPAVRARHPEARLSLVGSHPTAAVQRLAMADPSVEVTGSVPDVRPYLWKAAVSVAPLFVARGIQNKVLEAVAAGLPCVVTPAVREGLPDEVAPACTTASDAQGFADAVNLLLDRSADARREIAFSARLNDLDWERRLAPLLDVLREASTLTLSR